MLRFESGNPDFIQDYLFIRDYNIKTGSKLTLSVIGHEATLTGFCKFSAIIHEKIYFADVNIHIHFDQNYPSSVPNVINLNCFVDISYNHFYADAQNPKGLLLCLGVKTDIIQKLQIDHSFQ